MGAGVVGVGIGVGSGVAAGVGTGVCESSKMRISAAALYIGLLFLTGLSDCCMPLSLDSGTQHEPGLAAHDEARALSLKRATIQAAGMKRRLDRS